MRHTVLNRSARSSKAWFIPGANLRPGAVLSHMLRLAHILQYLAFYASFPASAFNELECPGDFSRVVGAWIGFSKGEAELVSNDVANGDITDPPVATFEEASPGRSFAKAIPPPTWSTASADDSVFCQTCIKNQHLYRSSLAQYLPEDPDHPDYDRLSKNIQHFQQQLEERYPQVCENCVDKVQDRMKRAVYSAKVDAHGRQLERTRRNGGPGRKTKRTWLESIQYGGQVAWKSGIYLQLACEVLTLLGGFQPTVVDSFEDDSILSDSILDDGTGPSPPFLYRLVSPVLSAGSHLPDVVAEWLPNLAATSLLLSLGSLWWNPQFRYTIKNGLHEVHGLQSWYIHQAVLLLARGLLWYVNGKSILGDAKSSINMAAHTFIFAFTVWISMTTTRKVTARSKPLFSSTPDREALIAKRKATASPSHPPNSLYEALNSISQEPTVASSPVSSQGTPRNFGQSKPWDSPGSITSISYRNRETPSKSASALSIGGSPSQFSPTNRGALGTYQSNIGQSTSMDASSAPDPDEMEWMPSQSVHRAFNSGLSAQRDGQHFNQAPSGPESSPFWFKVPPAPITPARKLRNPPNQPLLSAPSEEVKQNFFNRMTSNMLPNQGSQAPRESSRQDVAFAQPKFFPPDALEDTTGLADAFGAAFSFDEREAAENERAAREKAQSRDSSPASVLSGNLTAAALCVLLWFWNLSFHRPTEYSRSMTQAAMTGCILIGLRSLMDHTTVAISKTSSGWSVAFAILATIESAAAVYILVASNALAPDAIGPVRTYGTALFGFMIFRQLLQSDTVPRTQLP
ncbi:hypothetical protein V492_01409 [Pseudogymnoascus sp. VKM F-4246]|nr:hypothetical protein V492_01409 [Pseudogymnoascus sp. VKM F-4246]